MILFQNLYRWITSDLVVLTFLQENIFKKYMKREELKAKKGLVTVESENTR